VSTQMLLPSTGVGGFATHGSGQYFTDLPPTGLLNAEEYSRALFNSPRVQHKVRYWVRINVAGLGVERVRGIYIDNRPSDRQAPVAGYSIYLKRHTLPLPIGGRIDSFGATTFR